MNKFFVIVALFFLSISGCRSNQDKNTSAEQAEQPRKAANNATSVQPPTLLTEELELALVELPPEAIALWPRHQEAKPALVLLSNDPFLQKIPKDLLSEINTAIHDENTDIFRTRGTAQVANPLLLPQQSGSAAIRAGLISRIVWVIPVPERGTEPTLEVFAEKLVENGVASREEAQTLTKTETGFSGVIQGIPVQIVFPFSLPKLSGPLILHIDLSYFTAQYQNEVRTPIYRLLHKTLTSLRDTRWPVSTVTLSLSTGDGTIPLQKRFIGNTIAEVFSDPDLLDKNPPEAWRLRKEGLYLELFFQPEEAFSIYQKLAEMTPKDAANHFDLYRVLMLFRDEEKALEHLDTAVSMDPGYGWEFANLAMESFGDGLGPQGIAYLERAEKLFPDNPFIRLQMAEAYLALGQNTQATPLLEALLQDKWSPHYYGDMPKTLQEMQRRARQATSKKQ